MTDPNGYYSSFTNLQNSSYAKDSYVEKCNGATGRTSVSTTVSFIPPAAGGTVESYVSLAAGWIAGGNGVIVSQFQVTCA